MAAVLTASFAGIVVLFGKYQDQLPQKLHKAQLGIDGQRKCIDKLEELRTELSG